MKYMSEYHQKRLLKNKELVDKHKRPCAKCGEYRPYLIQFHHINPLNKSFEISTFGARGKETIKNEISKCVCLCSNCHIEFHWLYGKRPENPVEALEEYLGHKL